VGLAGIGWSCAIESLPADDHCNESGYSIANRTLICTGDSKRANQIYENFRDQFQCTVSLSEGSNTANLYECAVNLRSLPCEQVNQLGDSLDGWVINREECTRILARKDGKKFLSPCAGDETVCNDECVDLKTNPFHCGFCGNLCEGNSSHPINKRAVCENGECKEPVCKDTSADCDGNPADCETALQSLKNCGFCGDECPSTIANGVPVCVASKCLAQCNQGFEDCDGDPSNGCEATISSPTSCGSCSRICPAKPEAPYHQAATCMGSTCGTECQPGFADCGGASDTCETNILTDLNHCGGCNQPCASMCVNGVCM
jgi:hypothetical protein